ncbi:hypothetical protein MKW94_013242 [Papaver nudicaule]|uniref:Fungal lipase-type domain-containing protein n=1 Tax=Papaver nudicaule TaxID=74823 RepID=A0AA42ARP1_PAPNU|nr:hypothetical protein [Papaver nudicaule]
MCYNDGSSHRGGGGEEFSEEYLVLKPLEGSLWDLLHLLFSRNVENNNFVECSEGTKVHGVKNRWILIVSVIAQRILLHLVKPMFWMGLIIETYLNLLLNYDNFCQFFHNLIQGKLVIPDNSSANYMSILGNLDTRLELDKNIKSGDSRYYGALSAMAAKLSYENEALIKATVTDKWKMKFLHFYDFWNDYQEEASMQAFMFQDKMDDPELIVVAFRGTEPFDADAWITDIDISWYDLSGIGKIHGGFMKALGLQKGLGWPHEIYQSEDDHRLFAYYTLREKLTDILSKNEKAKVIVTGHSLGGALAILFPTILAFHQADYLLKRFEGVYTFGQPRVGDKKIGEFVNDRFRIYGVKYLRYVYCNDLVPRIPYDDKSLLFKHFGTCLYFNSLYQGKVVVEEPNKNYFNPAKALHKILNACFELIRSFFIGYIAGPEYTEGWFLRLFRVVGLIIPGISAHCLQEYVNVTRLAFSNIPLDQIEDQPTFIKEKIEDLSDEQGYVFE